MYYDRHGKPIDQHAACQLFEHPEARRVALDKVGDVKISTVHLVIDHNYLGGEPLIFETLIFGGPRDGEMRRYETETQALAGHKVMLAELVAACATLVEIELELAGLLP